MKRIYIRFFVFLIGSAILPHPGFALSLVCPEDAAYPYEDSDAVVAGHIESITESSPEPPKDAVANIKIYKYWKLKNGELPKKIHISVGELRENASYMLFLKQNEHTQVYSLQVCSPVIEIAQQHGIKFNQIFYLKNIPLHSVK